MAGDAEKAERTKKKRSVTKQINAIRQKMAEEETAETVKGEVTVLKDLFIEFTSFHDQYHETLQSDADLDGSEAYFTDVQQSYIDVLKEVKHYTVRDAVDDARDDAASATSRESTDLTRDELRNLMTLPRVTLEVYDGDPLRYHAFMAVFDQNVGHMSGNDDAKLTRLLEYTSGKAKDAIRMCSLTGGKEGYDKAREILKARFGDDHIVTEKVIDELRRGRPIKSAGDLQAFADELQNGLAVLKKMGKLMELDTQSAIIEILGRLQPFIQHRWKNRALEMKRQHGRYPDFHGFVDFIVEVEVELNDPVYGKVNTRHQSTCNKEGKPKQQSFYASAKPDAASQELLVQNTPRRWQEPPCVLCSEPHRLWYCGKFKNKTPQERLETVRNHKLCENCLLNSHLVKDCRKQSVCSVPGCGKKHTKFLHQIEKVPVKNANVNVSKDIFMPVVPVVINDVYQTYALLYSASTTSFCVQNVANKLGVKGRKVTYDLCTLSRGSETKITEAIDLGVRAKNGHDELCMTNVYVTDNIPVTIPSCSGNFSHLRGLPLNHGNVEVEVLIGQDNSEALIPIEVRRGKRGEPFAMRTMLGWTINGPTGDVANGRTINYFLSASTIMKDDNLRPAWDEGVEDDMLGPSINDEKVLRLWKEKSDFVDGRYQLPIPWKEDVQFENNLEAVVPRLHSLRRSLQKKGLYEQYDSEVRKLLVKEYAEPVSGEVAINEKRTWYLPHQPVISDKKPGKLRLVFDCAAKYRGASLNDKALQGPDLNNKLSHVILRFREHPCAFMADVEAMYNQIRVPEEDRDALRFLWYEKDGTIQRYRMTRHLFGGIWCASAATYALRHSADGNVNPLVRGTVHNSFYVDDCLKSTESRDEAEAIIYGMRETLARSGFRLTKFVANDDELLFNLPTEEIAKEMRFVDDGMNSKALGIKWDVKSDQFYFSVTECDDAPTTRRRMLSYLSSLYDPLGLVGPVTLKGKMLYQEAVRQHLSWDDTVPAGLTHDWATWVDTLRDVEKVRIQRCIKPYNQEDCVMELHHFSDASEKAYGCCSYLRCANKNGQIHTALVMSKSKVAPIKSLTIPRLELQAAVLAARVDAMLRNELHLQLMPSHFWVDSEIVLRYIKNEDRRFQVFVANRVSTIRKITEPDQWQHIPGNDNPADIISRGSTARDIDITKWLAGPSFLKEHKARWQKRKIKLELEEGDPEVKRSAISHRIVAGETVPLDLPYAVPDTDTKSDSPQKSILPNWHPIKRLIDHCSSWHRLIRKVAWLLKMKTAMKNHTSIDKKITVQDLEESETEVIKYSQANMKNGSVSNYVKQLNAYVDSEGIIRVGGRIANTDMTYKDQAIVPNGDVAEMIIRHYHQTGHLGTEYTLAQLREKYWIQRREVKRVTRSCIICRKINGRQCTQKMADLPETRLAAEEPPFSHTGVDCFGPFIVKRVRSTVKRYGCVFTCLTTRAIHIEVLDRLDTDSFMNALRRFISRRGQPTSITSDNGGNFVCGNKELAAGLKELNQTKIYGMLLDKGIAWKFTPPHSSHMGGVWERQIRTIRKVIQGVVKEQSLNDESLRTLMCEVESIINNRPITSLSDKPNDLQALKPNHLLFLKEGPPMPPCLSDEADLYRRRWRQVQYLAAIFWKRWIKQYLPELQRRQKWMKEKPNVSVGDLVLMMDENVPRGLWPLARVIETYPSKDGLVRSAKVRTKNTQLTRPITKLVMLEGKLY